MKKRTLAMLLGVILAFGLAACGSTAPAEDTEAAEETAAEEVEEEEPAEPMSEDEIAQMFTDAKPFKGRELTLSGHVFTTPEKDGSSVYYQVFTDAENSENMVVVITDGSEGSVKFDDFVTFTGTVSGTLSGENALGGKVTAPMVTATSLEVVDAMEVIAPALASYDMSASVTQAGCTMTVTKVEFAEKETRVYVTVANDSEVSVDLNTNMEVAIQDGKQYDTIYSTNYFSEYPELSYSVRPGASTEGIVLFPALEEKPFEFILEGYEGANYNELTFDVNLEIGEKGIG